MTLSFLAQSHDNISPDTLINNGEKLTSQAERQQLTSEIFKLISEKTKQLDKPSITIYYTSPKFVIKIIPSKNNKDELNRLAPVYIYGNLSEAASTLDPRIRAKEICKEVAILIKKDNIDRELDEDTMKEIEKWLAQTMEKKIRTTAQIRISVLIIIIVIPTIVGGILQSQLGETSLNTFQTFSWISLNNVLLILGIDFLLSKPPLKSRKK
ncbi:hypothetical protein ACE1CI_21095 [Aerosakkonemataceae cyanobacterium BLCC-F50]|uniref:TPM domain-containing protein n=1 Tax=Floridaenema flaviceps BLCC-F50 TaxID=3153642 RepID=A0ABV4XUK3_9CYAN